LVIQAHVLATGDVGYAVEEVVELLDECQLHAVGLRAHEVLAALLVELLKCFLHAAISDKLQLELPRHAALEDVLHALFAVTLGEAPLQFGDDLGVLLLRLFHI
jgi:hypothetical protein